MIRIGNALVWPEKITLVVVEGSDVIVHVADVRLTLNTASREEALAELDRVQALIGGAK